MTADLAADGAASRTRWIGLSVLLLASFVTILDLFVVNLAIPSIQAELGASLGQMGMVLAGYELGFGALLITGGRLGDIFGRRRLFITGMAAFTLASLLCGLAPGIEFLIAARVVQGIAAALLTPQVYASIKVNFSGDDSRRAFSLVGMTLGGAAIAGQILGGVLVEANLLGLGWRGIFLINLPIGLAALALARFIAESKAVQAAALDLAGVALAGLALCLLLLPLMEAPAHGWPLPSTLSLAAALALFALFVLHQERRRRSDGDPLIDMRMFADAQFQRGCVLILLVHSTATSFFLCYALFVQSGLGLRPLEAAGVLVPCSIGFVATSLLSPRLTARFGPRVMLWGGLAYLLSFAIVIAQALLGSAGLVAAQLIPALALLGAAQGLIMPPLVDFVLATVPVARAGMAAGIISSLQQIGAALGVAIASIAFAATLTFTSDDSSSYPVSFAAGLTPNIAATLAFVLVLTSTLRHAGTPKD